MKCASILLVAVVLGLRGPATATAAGSRDLADAWLVAVDAVGCGHEPTWQVGLATGRLFSVSGLEQKGLSGRLARGRWHVGATWERLGGDLYVEDLLRMQVGVGRRWTLGVEGGADRLVLGGAAARTCPVVAMRAGIPLGNDLQLEIWSHLHEPPPWYGRKGLRRLATLGGRYDAWAWAVALDRSVDGFPALQAEVSVQVAPLACLGVRIDPWSGAVGLSSTWRIGLGWLRTSHLVHPDLGTTHRWALVLGARAKEVS